MECASKLVLFHKFRKKCEYSNHTIFNAYMSAAESEPHCSKVEEFVENSDDNVAYKTSAQDCYVESNEDDIDGNESSDRLVEEYVIPSEMNVHIKDDDKSNEEEYLEKDQIIENSDSVDEESQDNYTEENMEIYDEQNDDKTIEIIISDEDQGNDPILMATNDQNKQQPRRNRREPSKNKCEDCGREFSRKSTLIQHRITHTGVKNFSCQQCERLFTRKSHLKIHMRIHTNQKPYICEICSRGFTKSSDLLRHQRVHSVDRNFPCLTCGKRFKRSADVLTHMRTHTGAKPYKCKFCNKTYTSHTGLKKHSQTSSCKDSKDNCVG